ncbi:MAG: CBS domain-containing protein [Spongiibacteraceae bacterium]
MNNSSVLSVAFLERKPAAAANLLQQFPPQQAVDFLQTIPLPVLVPVMDKMPSWPGSRILSLLPSQLSADILCELLSAEAESMLALMTSADRNEIIELMPDQHAKSFSRRLIYPESTVGAWMDSSNPYFAIDCTVADCLDQVKRHRARLGGVVVVVDERRHLVGLVDIEKLLASESDELLGALLNEDLQTLAVRATLWEVSQHSGWANYLTLPVIDRNAVVLGTLRYAALVAGMAKPAAETDETVRFSLITHLGRAFFISLGGMLQVLSGEPRYIGDETHQTAKRSPDHGQEASREH